MIERESVPNAPALIESMRSIGYSFKTALADLIDNSLSAKSSNIDIMLSPGANPILGVLDDGHGMSPDTLMEAMRYGSMNPLNERNSDDLGRFGLGMKSASLSQCRKLTVASKMEGTLSAYSWDLNRIIETGRWSLLELSDEEIEKIQYIGLLKKSETGTLVILEDFDRIKKTTANLENTLVRRLDETVEHLSLVFHRYLEEGVIININNDPLMPRDPFLSKNSNTIHKREQSFTIDDQKIVVKPFILPHANKLTLEDNRLIGGKESLRREQGFYIYRNKRLIVWGTWFNIENKHELNKLARVRVDIPNTLDYVWSIDIKKSAARLPDIIKKNLHSVVFDSIQTSSKVHSFRGRKEEADRSIQYVWERLKTRTGYIYQVNRKNPRFEIFSQRLDSAGKTQFERLIRSLEESFPAATMYLDVANNSYMEPEKGTTERYYEEIKEELELAVSIGLNPVTILESYLLSEPYCEDEDLKEKLRKEWTEG